MRFAALREGRDEFGHDVVRTEDDIHAEVRQITLIQQLRDWDVVVD